MVKSYKTTDEFTSALPKLTSNPLPIQPPFVFNGMSSRCFPLRAHLGTLQRLVDGYMNFVPPEVGYFRVPMPYVVLMVLDYGQVAEAVARIGWFAQTEVFFMIPLEWYKLVNGKYVFYDWAVITPYVFVNDEFSVPLGRTVFGFPKVLARVDTIHSAWVKDATAPVTLARVETSVFPQTYSGSDIESRVFLEVERGTVSNMQLPFDASSPVTPWSIATHVAQAAAGFGRDALWLAQSMRLSTVNPASDPGVLPAMLRKMAPWFAPGGSGFIQNSINLKQFRRSNVPDQICYQALTNGRMETKSFNGAGLLGEYPIMLGDLSGGHTVRLYEYASLPIIRTLGLEVDRQWRGPDCDVAELKPVVPYWLDVDIRYDQGDTLVWRTDDRVWRGPTGAPLGTEPQTAAAESPAYNQTVTTAIDDIAGPFEFCDSTVRVLPLLAERSNLQNFVDTYVNDPFEGPLVGQHGKKERIRFRVWGRGQQEATSSSALHEHAYVYLMVSSFGGVTSTTNNVGDWTKYQMSFMIPVRFERANPLAEGGWEIAGVGMVPAFSFVDNCISAIARLEVQGFEATVANFFKPESVWLSDEVELSENPPQTLLRVDSEVWPAIGEGQKAVVLPVVEICQGLPDAGLGAAPDAPWRWSEQLTRELEAKKQIKALNSRDLQIARALSLELLGSQMPFTAYSLKQFRDARDPQKACYQSLVRVPRLIKELVDVREIEETLVVRIHNYPSLDIVGTLGLVANQVFEGGTGIVNTVQAVRPFFVRGTLFEPLADRLAYRAGSDPWTLDCDVIFSTPLSDEPNSPPITADFLAEQLQDQMDPCRIGDIMYQAAQRRNAEAAELKVAAAADPKDAQAAKLKAAASAKAAEPDRVRFSKAEARDALMDVDPQTVIESILSREWGNTDPKARWRVGRTELIRTFSALPLTGDASAFAESVLFRRINNSLALAPGAVAAPVPIMGGHVKAVGKIAEYNLSAPAKRWKQTIEAIILSQEKFARERLKMENTLGLLASAAIFNPIGIKSVYKDLGEDPPSDKQLLDLCGTLMKTLETIGSLSIAGQPSEQNNLNTRVANDLRRFTEVNRQLWNEFTVGFLAAQSAGKLELPDEIKNIDPQLLQWAFDHTAQFQQLVDLARRYCEAQGDAFLNKLSRAYQKPDFCIRRDSVPDCTDLLPYSLSWNADWYYGEQPARPAAVKSPSAPTVAASKPSASASGPGTVKSNGVANRGRKRTKV